MDKEHSNCPGSTAQVQPPVMPISILEPNVSRTQTKPTIPYLSRLNDQKLQKKATNQMEKFFQIFHDLHFDISFADALLLIPKFASTIKSLLANKDKLFELAKVLLNENCSAMLLKKLLEKLVDPADSRVPLILGRSFLRIGRALIDVYGEEITLRVNDEFITFNLNQTMRYSSTYDDNSVNRVDVIDIAYEDFIQDVLDFQNKPKSSNPTLVSDLESDFSKEHIVKSSSPTLTLFRESDFFLEEIEEFLNDDSIPMGIENSVYDPEGAEESKAKSSIEEPPELEFKELPSHLEYAFLEDSNKLLVIIAKDLNDVKKEALINVLKSHKQAIAWKSPTLRVLPEILYSQDLNGGRLQTSISESKKGMTVVSNENNELIPTRLVTGWRVCIYYRKLNDATRKDHFLLPFMDQMLERLAGNEFYCFLDVFSGYFQIPIDPQDQEKTTFTCPYGTFA
nr:reverse transcriptase domain-containing protein [Tanacetum cinerariifolium]